jgi:ABC-2 type transport system ATP-binding protein
MSMQATTRREAGAAILADGVSKHYTIAETGKGVSGAFRALWSTRRRVVKAVDGVSFAVEPGSFVGYLGPNGAGKSTTVKMLAGILHPSGGEVRVLGRSPQRQRQEVAQRIGVVFGQRTQLWWDLPLADSYELIAAMYGVPGAVAAGRLRRLDELLGIGELMDTQVRKLSLGQRMRADLAGALLHGPEVLFLDEPTIGLDVVAKAAIRDFLLEVNAAGVTILLTTHDMDDVERLCRRIMVINHGRLAFDGTVGELRAAAGVPTTMHLDFAAELAPTLDLRALVAAANGALAGAGVTAELAPGGRRATVTFDRARTSAARVIAAFQDCGEITDIQISDPNIEEIVRRVYTAG